MADLSRVVSWMAGEVRKAELARDDLKKEKKAIDIAASECQQRLEQAETLLLIMELASEKIAGSGP